MSITSWISQATGEVARAAERVNKAESELARRVERQAVKLTTAADQAVGHIENAARLVASAAGTVTRALPLLEGDVVRRGIGVIGAAAGKLAASRIEAVRGAAATLRGAVAGLEQKVGALGGVGAAAQAPPVVPSSTLKTAPTAADTPAAAAAMKHLLVLCADDGARYHFGLSSSAFDSLRRQSTFGIEGVPRLGRRDATQAVGQGSESLSLSGTVFVSKLAAREAAATGPYADLEQDVAELDKLRRIGLALRPLLLTTGYGDVLGRWYMGALTEEQGGLRAGGHARKQTFTLEFKRYGDDYQKR
ncbi:phage tail protein [Pseudoduganella namucuonensis]|uniref:Phage tail protein n=1 Tax=Pseudoduganella namucuonensis TaxID=1035707 RepID=A0A1I7J3I0_9BURK|nr:phage tail protein [Pseudoduganella namucuonensis]SFU79769.1 hypothetical protein SAMN05216552_101032 [Pseudoduganella namucuonensis]